GATVFSYIQAGKERLFASSKSSVHGSDPAAIRGGIPICWPVFGPPNTEAYEGVYSKLKQHGFARTSTWTYSAEESGSDGEGEKAVFRQSRAQRAPEVLASTAETRALFDRDFSLKYTVHLLPSALTVSLGVTSPSSSSSTLPFQALLHSYLRLPSSVSPPQVRVTPLNTLTFVDKVTGGKQGKEDREVVEVQGPKGEVDRVYYHAPDVLEIKYEGTPGSMKVTKEHLADVVLWNPGPEKGATIGDMEEGGAGRYVCLEPGQVSSFVELSAGQSWEGKITLEFTD
ncbi:galactose mutarotase-like domain-containing protein, partial [Leucosporidium creatinivorum]